MELDPLSNGLLLEPVVPVVQYLVPWDDCEIILQYVDYSGELFSQDFDNAFESDEDEENMEEEETHVEEREKSYGEEGTTLYVDQSKGRSCAALTCQWHFHDGKHRRCVSLAFPKGVLVLSGSLMIVARAWFIFGHPIGCGLL
ncbi:hypothetical protein ACFE04_009758 [Oxalis oulophora]